MLRQTSNIFKTLLILSLPIITLNQAQARDDKLMMPIDEVVKNEKYTGKINPDIALYFGDQKHPKVSRKYGGYTSNKKTNGFKKPKNDSCQWAMLSALMSLQDRAIKEGGNAVINIESYYNRTPVSSQTEYECHAGKLMVGVALQGDVVTLEGK